MRGLSVIRRELIQQHGHMFCWVPVCLALGIGGYFSLSLEPSAWAVLGTVSVCLAAAWAARGLEPDWAAILWAVALVAAGFALAVGRAHVVAGPVLEWRYYGAIEGRVVGIDRSASDAVRLTLADVRLSGISQQETPRKVRVSLHGDQSFIDPKPDMFVGLTGHLSPPSGPVEPGGFDFQRHAWFKGIGGVGYTRTPVLEIVPADTKWSVFALRMGLSERVQNRMPDNVGGFAAAVITGDRSALAKQTIEDLRRSNLAHLLAISGLHMGLLAGFVFSVVRLGLAAVPPVGLRVNGKKVAAVVALIAASLYLMMSGGNVATQRAFVMAAVMLTAILIDRRALSLRAVAVAATIVLVLRPEALLGPGFQMSFAATVALVAVFGWLRDHDLRLGPRWLRPMMAVVMSSFVAGLATAPFAAMHFNQIAHYGLPANLVSVPVMGIVVVPSAVLAGVLSPIGLEGVGLYFMALGLRWILSVAHFVANLDGARGTVPSGNVWVLPMLGLGSLWVILWHGRSRLAGGLVVIAAFALWLGSERPDVLIEDSGSLVGVVTPQGRALSKNRGQGFVALNWLENDGSSLDQDSAASLWPDGEKGLRVVDLDGAGKLIHVQGKRGMAMFSGCAPEDLVVSSTAFDRALPCPSYQPDDLAKTGSIAIRLDGAEREIITARDISGTRLWNSTSQR